MSIEQTNQLILLILNSVLMALLSAGLLGGAWLRQSTLLQQLQQVRSRYRQLTHPLAASLPDTNAAHLDPTTLKSDLKKIRDHRQRLNQQYHWSHIGMLVLHLSLIIFSVSLVALTLRTIFAFDGLISAALILFTVGAGSLLAGSGCILIDLVQGNHHNDTLGRSLGQVVMHIAKQWPTKQKLQQLIPVGSTSVSTSEKP